MTHRGEAQLVIKRAKLSAVLREGGGPGEIPGLLVYRRVGAIDV